MDSVAPESLPWLLEDILLTLTMYLQTVGPAHTLWVDLEVFGLTLLVKTTLWSYRDGSAVTG